MGEGGRMPGEGLIRAGVRADVFLASKLSWLHPKSPVSRHVPTENIEEHKFFGQTAEIPMNSV
jgi:hypothetical protein